MWSGALHTQPSCLVGGHSQLDSREVWSGVLHTQPYCLAGGHSESESREVWSGALHTTYYYSCLQSNKASGYKAASFQKEARATQVAVWILVIKWQYYSRRQVALGAARGFCKLNKSMIEAADSPILADRPCHGPWNSLPVLWLFGGSPKLAWQDCKRNSKEAPFNKLARA